MTDKVEMVQLVIESRLENVYLLGMAVSAFAKNLGLDEMHCYQLETCVVEAVNNAIIHAYEHQPGQWVKMTWRMDGEKISLSVCDTGKTIPEIPQAASAPLDEESGRGWFIMRQWMDEVEYLTHNQENCLTMIKYLHNSGS